MNEMDRSEKGEEKGKGGCEKQEETYIRNGNDLSIQRKLVAMGKNKWHKKPWVRL